MLPSLKLTDRDYWDRTWSGLGIPSPVDLENRGIQNHATLALHNRFEDVFSKFRGRQASFIELGCAQSKWLPYFARHWNFSVAGLDASELGCQRSREMLANSGVQGEVVCGDLLNPPRQMIGRFDIAFSQGLVEHFTDTSSAIAACAAFVKPGGIVVTIIPNMTGLVGLLQAFLDRKVYDVHVPMTFELLSAAHQKAGLSVLRCDYLLSANFAVVNHPNIRARLVNKVVRAALVGATGLVWAVERAGLPIPPSWLMSPYVFCVAKVP